MHAHEVPAAPVPSGVVLGLQLRVEPRLHGGPLVRRVAAALRAPPAGRRGKARESRHALVFCLQMVALSLSPSLSLTRTRTRSPQGPSKTTKTKSEEKLLASLALCP